jgi:hypothetical protein
MKFRWAYLIKPLWAITPIPRGSLCLKNAGKHEIERGIRRGPPNAVINYERFPHVPSGSDKKTGARACTQRLKITVPGTDCKLCSSETVTVMSKTTTIIVDLDYACCQSLEFIGDDLG